MMSIRGPACSPWCKQFGRLRELQFDRYAPGVRNATRAARGRYRYSGQRMKYRTHRRVERAAPIARKATQRHATTSGMMQRDRNRGSVCPNIRHGGKRRDSETLLPSLEVRK